MKIVKGYICCGELNPFYNDMVELEVMDEWTGWDGRHHIEVKTVEKRLFKHCLIDVRTNEITKEWEEMEHYEHFLDTSKPYEIIE